MAQIDALFKATENKAIYSKPFVPVIAARPLLQVENIVLNTEQRSQRCTLYEEEKRDRERRNVHNKKKRSTDNCCSTMLNQSDTTSYGDKELATPITPKLITSQRCRNVK